MYLQRFTYIHRLTADILLLAHARSSWLDFLTEAAIGPSKDRAMRRPVSLAYERWNNRDCKIRNFAWKRPNETNNIHCPKPYINGYYGGLRTRVIYIVWIRCFAPARVPWDRCIPSPWNSCNDSIISSKAASDELCTRLNFIIVESAYRDRAAFYAALGVFRGVCWNFEPHYIFLIMHAAHFDVN